MNPNKIDNQKYFKRLILPENENNVLISFCIIKIYIKRLIYLFKAYVVKKMKCESIITET